MHITPPTTHTGTEHNNQVSNTKGKTIQKRENTHKHTLVHVERLHTERVKNHNVRCCVGRVLFFAHIALNPWHLLPHLKLWWKTYIESNKRTNRKDTTYNTGHAFFTDFLCCCCWSLWVFCYVQFTQKGSFFPPQLSNRNPCLIRILNTLLGLIFFVYIPFFVI